MSVVFDIADRYVDELAELDPDAGTQVGIAGHAARVTDHSPEGAASIDALDRRAVRMLEKAPVEGEGDRIALDVMLERLRIRSELFDAGGYLRPLRVIGSPLGSIRGIFDQMPKVTVADWRAIAERLAHVPEGIERIRRSLTLGVERGIVAAKRQVRECAQQAEVWAGLQPGKPSFFAGLVAAFQEAALDEPSLRADLARGAAGADAAYASIRRYLRDEYLPHADDADGVGDERYELYARAFTGSRLDLRETYAWGWAQLYEIEAEMQKTARRIQAGAGVREAIDLLETDPARAIGDADEYRTWLQELHDEAIAQLNGRHFDIDPRIRSVQVMFPPAGGALAPYYSGPSEDFSRPGRTWWPLGTRRRFPTWAQVSTAYHEGVPGHLLQIGAVRCMSDRLSRYQRTLGSTSGYGEGWALYAERLMGELGYLEQPGYYMGMLSVQAMRAVRMIVDIGMHLGLRIPANDRFHPGETWSHDLALDFAVERSFWPREFMASEIVRYLGWPGQAISYKVGERAWLAARSAARERDGAGFDLKAFHARALEMGPMGLDRLARELAM
jgi:uncharacterized protein (DUF885 family)